MRVQVAADGSGQALDGECTDQVFMLPSRLCLAPQNYLPARKNGKAAKGVGEIVVNYIIPKDDSSLLDTMIAGMFGLRRAPASPLPEDDICKRRSGDMISSLPGARG